MPTRLEHRIMASPYVAFPGAVQKRISRNYGGKRRSTRGVIFHVAVSEAGSLQGWFNNPAAKASSHLYVRRDGTIEQYVSMDAIAWTSGKANADTIGVETQGMGHGKWTTEQLAALARIARWVADTYGVPLRAMTSSGSREKGVGWHALGVPANRTQKLLGRSQTGGQLWSSSVGKTCPGPDRIKQIPGIIAAAAGRPAPAPSKPAPAPAPKPSGGKVGGEWPGSPLLVDGTFGPITRRAYQRLLSWDVTGKYAGRIDGQIGPMTTRAEQTWLRKVSSDVGPVDGVRGPRTIRALQRFLKKKGLYSGLIDGDQGPMTTKALQSYLNDQRKYA